MSVAKLLKTEKGTNNYKYVVNQQMHTRKACFNMHYLSYKD
jgi:hypothetical protein